MEGGDKMLQTQRSSMGMTPQQKHTPQQFRERRTRAQRKGENFDTVGDLNATGFNQEGGTLKYTYEWQDREVGMFQNQKI